MPRFSPIRLEHDLQAIACEEFIRTLALMDSSEAYRNLFLGLFSKTELVMFARRLHAAKLLIAGETYKNIAKKLQMSEDTVRNVSHRVVSGDSGMRRACEILEQVGPKIRREISEAIEEKFSQGYASLKSRYTSHHMVDHIVGTVPGILKEKQSAKQRNFEF